MRPVLRELLEEMAFCEEILVRKENENLRKDIISGHKTKAFVPHCVFAP